MQYMNKFTSKEEYNQFVVSDKMVRPSVALISEPFEVCYNDMLVSGVYIQHIDGSLYTKEDWIANNFEKSVANGIAVVDDKGQFVISIGTGEYRGAWYDGDEEIDLPMYSSSDIRNNYSGYENTKKMLEKNAKAATVCNNFKFPNGNRGYLPSIGEWLIAYKNRDLIDPIIELLSAQTLATSNSQWSSNPSSDDGAYAFRWNTNKVSTQAKTYTSNTIRPFGLLY